MPFILPVSLMKIEGYFLNCLGVGWSCLLAVIRICSVVVGKHCYHCRPQLSRQMLPIHCHAWSCLSNAMLECISPTNRFPPKTVNEKKFLSTESLTFILTEKQ